MQSEVDVLLGKRSHCAEKMRGVHLLVSVPLLSLKESRDEEVPRKNEVIRSRAADGDANSSGRGCGIDLVTENIF